MNKKTQSVNEGLLGAFLHNVKLKLFFSQTFIKSWKTGEGEDGVTKYNWEKTPTTPGNLNVAWNTLNELQTYYTSVPKDVKGLQAAQGGAIGSIFNGFWVKVFQRIMGNPTKLASIAKFHEMMSGQVTNLTTELNNLWMNADAELKKAGINTKKAPAATSEGVLREAAPAPATPPTGAPAEDDKVTQHAKLLRGQLTGILEVVDTKVEGYDKFKECIDNCVGSDEAAFIQACKDAIDGGKFDQDKLEVAGKHAQEVRGNNQLVSAFVEEILELLGKGEVTVVELVNVLGEKRKTDTIAGDVAGGIQALMKLFASVNDNTTTQIEWERGGLGSMSNIYRAEDSLYKVLVFFGAWIDNLNRGIQYDAAGDRMELSTEEVMEWLKTPAGKRLQSFQRQLSTVNNTFAKNSGFGTLQESEMRQIQHGIQVCERIMEAQQKKAQRTKGALNKLKACMEMTEPEQQAPVLKDKPQEAPRDSAITLEFDYDGQCHAKSALQRLKGLVYDGDIPKEEPIVEVQQPVDDKDEVIQVNEAPGDPNDPNADPNAAPADPNAPPPADPGAAMNVSDLGAPPVAADDPTMGGTADAAAGDPTMGGMDAGAADPTAAAPAPDAGADPTASADPNAAPADPNAAAAPAAQNAMGAAPNDPNAGKFDIGVDRPFNNSTDELHLTDQEQEQLFSKINLLSKVPDLVNYGKYLYNITPENVDLNDIHYINSLYELSVKLGLLTDDFEGNNLLDKYDSYKFSVLSKNPENDLQAAAQQVAETSRKVKTENAGEVTIVNAPGLVIAKDIDDYMKQKDDANAEAAGEITFRGTLDRMRGLGSLVTFTGVMFGYPTIKTLYLKGPKDEKIAKDEAIKQLNHQGYRDVEILAIEPIDPIDYLYHEYAGMRTLEDEFTREFMKQRMEKKVAKAVARVNESVESKSIIPQEFDDDVGKIVDTLNKEIMEDPTIDFSKDIGLPKMMVTKEDFERCYVEAPITEDDDECDCSCQFCVTKTGAGNLPKVLFSSNCQRICKCLEGIVQTYGYNLKAIAEGEDILKGADKITLTLSK